MRSSESSSPGEPSPHPRSSQALRASLTGFISPSRCQASPRELDALSSFEAFRIDAPRERQDSNCAEVMAYSLGEGPPVLLVHGWGGRAAQFASFVDPLRASGFRVLAFDAPAHGETAGQRTSVFEFVACVQAIAERVGPLHGVVGHSLGGASLTMALGAGLKVKRAALIAPTPNLDAEVDRFVQRAGLSPEEDAALRELLPNHFRPDFWSSTTLLGLAPRLETPALIIHDEHDPDVPFSASEQLARAWPGASFHGTHGLGHLTVLRNAAVAQRVVDYFGG